MFLFTLINKILGNQNFDGSIYLVLCQLFSPPESNKSDIAFKKLFNLCIILCEDIIINYDHTCKIKIAVR